MKETKFKCPFYIDNDYMGNDCIFHGKKISFCYYSFMYGELSWIEYLLLGYCKYNRKMNYENRWVYAPMSIL